MPAEAPRLAELSWRRGQDPFLDGRGECDVWTFVGSATQMLCRRIPRTVATCVAGSTDDRGAVTVRWDDPGPGQEFLRKT